MMEIGNVSGKFLLSVPGLDDPNFRHSVVLVCEHSREGAFGLIVNRVLMDSIRSISGVLGFERIDVDFPVYYGGPVKADQGYVIYTPYDEHYGAVRIGDDLAVTASREILVDIANGRGPSRFLFALGFSGWASNQLEEELVSDSWLVTGLDLDIIFTVPVSERWTTAGRGMGVDFGRYFGGSGSA